MKTRFNNESTRRPSIVLALLLAPLAAHAAEGQQPSAPSIVVPDKVSPQAYAFDLNQVRLLDGPFNHAQERDRQYLLKLDVDLLTYPFRREAKLPTPVKGNDNLDFISTGHYLGHYLSACALMVRNTGDPELKRRADGAVAVLAQCQARIGTGFVMGFPEQKMKEFIETGKALPAKDSPQNITAPWYSLHKVYAGLLDMYVLTGNRQALEVVQKAVDWLWANIGQISEKRMNLLVLNEIGGMSELLANLHAATGREEYLILSKRFQEKDLMQAFAKGEDPLDGRHANSRIPRFTGTVRQYALTADPVAWKIARGFWTVVTEERSYVTGGNSAAERFSPKARLSQFIHDNTCETCNSYNMLKLTRGLFCLEARAAYADYYERTLYNHILASQHPETGGMISYHQLGTGRPISEKWSTPNGLMGCCYGTGLENHAKYADSIYFHDGHDGLFVNLFIASELDWKEKGVRLRQETAYPDQPSTRLVLSCDKPRSLALNLRRPWWATAGFDIEVNGKKQDLPSAPGSYVKLQREWRSGDTVEVSMSMTFRMEGFRDNSRRAAVMYGPLVMAARTEPNNRFAAIVSEDDRFSAGIQPVAGKPLGFAAAPSVFRTSPLVLGTEPVLFKPLCRFVDEPKVVYWDVCSSKEFERYADALKTETNRQKELEPATVDWVLCSVNRKDILKDGKYTMQGLLLGQDGAERMSPCSLEQVSEDAHGLELSPTGNWRPSTDYFPNGLFCRFRFVTSHTLCYRMRALPDREQELHVRLWRPKYDRSGVMLRSPGAFEALVEGTLIGSCRVESLPLEQFRDLAFPIPAELTKGKDHVKITIRAAKGSTDVQAGIYECRIVKKTSP